MIPPHYVDVEFNFVVHDPTMFDHGYIGIFWASYINNPGEIGINFKGSRTGQPRSSWWIYAFSEEHGKNATHIGIDDTLHPYMASNFNVTLASGISDYQFIEPYYYGRFHNMVFGYLFSKPEKGFIRMSQSPNGTGPGNPAWDFHYILPDFVVGKEYSVNLRLFYKEWVSQQDIEHEYEKWKQN